MKPGLIRHEIQQSVQIILTVLVVGKEVFIRKAGIDELIRPPDPEMIGIGIGIFQAGRRAHDIFTQVERHSIFHIAGLGNQRV